MHCLQLGISLLRQGWLDRGLLIRDWNRRQAESNRKSEGGGTGAIGACWELSTNFCSGVSNGRVSGSDCNTHHEADYGMVAVTLAFVPLTLAGVQANCSKFRFYFTIPSLPGDGNPGRGTGISRSEPVKRGVGSRSHTLHNPELTFTGWDPDLWR
ncbi:hypothetical protein Pmani_013363 [Petrolisthes manimaculis]|uniref:Uncharacterized protein n=1 Tax=Petrolisthes manimaculis TaxID=1843537 RepID=A0AAE1PYS8_9EUCA|nr:hypothetical protein Pmani_013363 [Petrolisthes manimaculis]